MISAADYFAVLSLLAVSQPGLFCADSLIEAFVCRSKKLLSLCRILLMNRGMRGIIWLFDGKNQSISIVRGDGQPQRKGGICSVMLYVNKILQIVPANQWHIRMINNTNTPVPVGRRCSSVLARKCRELSNREFCILCGYKIKMWFCGSGVWKRQDGYQNETHLLSFVCII